MYASIRKIKFFPDAAAEKAGKKDLKLCLTMTP